MSLRPQKTAADYLAIAICPALIMVLVGSLVMFLLEVGYEGSSLFRLRWTLFWFVFAMVLVSRIAIEQTAGAAVLYGLLLAWATFIMLTRYLGSIWQVWLLLAVIWWASNKLVWDCTLIDDDQDASGQGLLQGRQLPLWLRPPSARVRAVPAEQGAAALPPQSLLPPPPPKPLPGSARAKKAALAKRKSQDVHSPGLWILYFSLAAIPVFGAGELLLARGDAASRRFGFLMLFAYVSSGLALLLLTSFLGLRRYLRQRGIAMPASLARSWITRGAVLVLCCLALALVLPRPVTPYSWAHLPKLSTPKPDAGSRSSTSQDAADSSSAPPQDGNAQSSAGGERGQGKSQPTPSQPQSPSPTIQPPNLSLERWMSYLVAAVLAILALWWFGPEIRSGLRSLFAGLSGWRSKRRRQANPASRTRPGPSDPGAKPVLTDPFLSGAASRMSPPELVRYTYDSLREWAQARGFSLDESETPLEFAERLAQRERALAREILLVGSYYAHVVYANQEPPDGSLDILKQLWSVIGFRR